MNKRYTDLTWHHVLHLLLGRTQTGSGRFQLDLQRRGAWTVLSGLQYTFMRQKHHFYSFSTLGRLVSRLEQGITSCNRCSVNSNDTSIKQVQTESQGEVTPVLKQLRWVVQEHFLKVLISPSLVSTQGNKRHEQRGILIGFVRECGSS